MVLFVGFRDSHGVLGVEAGAYGVCASWYGSCCGVVRG